MGLTRYPLFTFIKKCNQVMPIMKLEILQKQVLNIGIGIDIGQ